MTKIVDIKAREIIDSRGCPTVEVDVRLSSGVIGRASVPAGASIGEFEAVELRDTDNRRYFGKGVRGAVFNIHDTIKHALYGYDCSEQFLLDRLLVQLDNTDNKSNLGANAMLAVSLAVARAAAKSLNYELYAWLRKLWQQVYNADHHDTHHHDTHHHDTHHHDTHHYDTHHYNADRHAGDRHNTDYHGADRQVDCFPAPMMNIINGGKHANNNLSIQECMIVPVKAESWGDALRIGAEIYHALRLLLEQRRISTCVGDEGGFAPDVSSIEEALDLIILSIESAGFIPGDDVFLAIDVAASEFVTDANKDGYSYMLSGVRKAYAVDDMLQLYSKIHASYPLLSIEDPFAAEDWKSWSYITKKLGNKLQIVGDDLFVTNCRRLERGIAESAANAILIKPNQIGTLSETFAAIATARKANFGTILSHRSGETEDTFAADLAIGCNFQQIKFGAPCRSERTSKYNQLLRIEEEMTADNFIGKRAFARFLS